MRKLAVALIMAAGLATAQPADADPIRIVDTGELGPSSGGWALDSGNWLAGKFSVSQDSTITSVEGFIAWANSNPASVSFRLYKDVNDYPGVPVPLFKQTFTFSGTNVDGAWKGPSGLIWPIFSGNSYWLAFEVYDAGFSGNMPSPFINPAKPLLNEAFSYGDYSYSTTGPPEPPSPYTLNLGVRVYAEPVISGTSVPDTTPTAFLFLLSAGLIGAGLRRSRRPTV